MQSIRRLPSTAYSSHSLHSSDVMANEQTNVTRVADCGELPLLLDKARQFAGQYIDSLEKRPVFPAEKSRAGDACPGRTAPRRFVPKHQAEVKFAMARTSSPARETRALPRNPLRQQTLHPTRRFGTGRPCF